MSNRVNIVDIIPNALNHFGYLIICSHIQLEIGSIIPKVTGFDGPCHVFSEATEEEVDSYRQFYLNHGAQPGNFRDGAFSYKVSLD